MCELLPKELAFGSWLSFSIRLQQRSHPSILRSQSLQFPWTSCSLEKNVPRKVQTPRDRSSTGANCQWSVTSGNPGFEAAEDLSAIRQLWEEHSVRSESEQASNCDSAIGTLSSAENSQPQPTKGSCYILINFKLHCLLSVSTFFGYLSVQQWSQWLRSAQSSSWLWS